MSLGMVSQERPSVSWWHVRYLAIIRARISCWREDHVLFSKSIHNLYPWCLDWLLFPNKHWLDFYHYRLILKFYMSGIMQSLLSDFILQYNISEIHSCCSCISTWPYFTTEYCFIVWIYYNLFTHHYFWYSRTSLSVNMLLILMGKYLGMGLMVQMSSVYFTL